jgi:hypothetical protein
MARLLSACLEASCICLQGAIPAESCRFDVNGRYSASGEMRFDVDVSRNSASGEMRTLTFVGLPVGSDVDFMHVYTPGPRHDKACFIGIFSLAWPAGDT